MNYSIEKSDLVYKGKIFDLKVDQILYKSGNKGVRETAVHPGGAVVVPLKDNGKIIFVSQFRYPVNSKVIELPAGKLDAGEDPMKCAIRELEEETGYKTDKIEKLASIATTPGFCSEILHIFLARDLTPGDHKREEGEQDMEIFEYDLSEARDLILSGKIYDAKTISGIYLAEKYLKLG
jgi:ADP-ribose pyrophosphatase